jgi:Uma2 family endonuclease
MPTVKSRPKSKPRKSAPLFATMGELLDRLGGITPHRVCADPPPGTATVRDFIRRDGRSASGTMCELIDRTLVEKPMGSEQTTLTMWIGYKLQAYLEEHPIAFVSGETYPLLVAPGLVRSPDISVTRWGLRPDGTFPVGPVARDIPALVLEVISPSNTPGEMRRKLAHYFAAGVEVVWFVDPQKFDGAIYTSPDDEVLLDETGVLTAESVLPGFALPLSAVFARMPKPAPKKRKPKPPSAP